MAAGSKRMCDLCDVQLLTRDAEVWCAECDESFCTNCKVQHGISRITKKHRTIAINDYKKLPFFVQSVKIYCKEHDERFEYYCSSHDTPSCVKCLTSVHRNCHQSLTPLHEVTEKSKTSKLTLDLEKTIKDLQINLQKVLNVQEKNLQSLHQQKDMCQMEIKECRREINERLDQLEKDLLDELCVVYSKYHDEGEDITSSLKARISTIKQFELDLSAIKQHATDLQMYLSLSDMMKESHDHEAYLQSLMDTHKIVRTNIHFVRHEEFTKCTEICIGKLDIKKEKQHVALTKEIENEAQILKFKPSKTFEQIKLKKKLCINIPRKQNPSGIFDCNITDDGLLLFANYDEECLLIYNIDGVFQSSVELYYRPFNFTILNNQLFTSDASQNFVHVLSTSNFQEIHKIHVRRQASATAVCGENIFIGYHNSGFDIKDTTGELVRKIETVQFHSPCFAVINGENILYSCYDENRVICMDMAGKRLRYMSNYKLETPIGITTDSSGNIFVAGFQSKNVMLFSADGRKSKEVIPSSEKLSTLRSIHYNQALKLLLISTEKCIAEVYEEC